jgi:uncharacterized Tic20 family protein
MNELHPEDTPATDAAEIDTAATVEPDKNATEPPLDAPDLPDTPVLMDAPDLPEIPDLTDTPAQTDTTDPMDVSDSTEDDTPAESAPVSDEAPVTTFDLPDSGLSFLPTEPSLDLPPLATLNPSMYQAVPPPVQPVTPQPSYPSQPQFSQQPEYERNPLPPQAPEYTPPNPREYETYQQPLPRYPQPMPYGYQEVAAPMSADSLTWGAAAHWGTLLSDIFFPVIGSIIVPVVIKSSKSQDRYVQQQATEALNFSLTMTLGLLLSLLLTVVGIGVLGFIIIPILVLIFRIQGAIAASRGEPYRYPISIRFVK